MEHFLCARHCAMCISFNALMTHTGGTVVILTQLVAGDLSLSINCFFCFHQYCSSPGSCICLTLCLVSSDMLCKRVNQTSRVAVITFSSVLCVPQLTLHTLSFTYTLLYSNSLFRLGSLTVGLLSRGVFSVFLDSSIEQELG